MKAEAQADPRPEPGMTRRKQARWVTSFLRALDRTGEVRVAAKDAGIDWSTAYARRRAHPDFAADWEAAVVAHRARVKAEEGQAIAALRLGSGQALKKARRLAAQGRPSPEGEGMTVSAGKVRRAGSGRWSQAKEKIFFDELAATANISIACEAVGISTNAIAKRRLNHPLFAAKFDAVVTSAGAGIDLYLIEQMKKSFDPETDLDMGDVEPRVTIDQGIKISQIQAKRRKAVEAEPDPWADEAAAMEPDAVEALREHILDKLKRMRARDMPGMIAQGWSFDEEHDRLVPPGWVRAGTSPDPAND